MEQKILRSLRAEFVDIDGDISIEPTTGQYNGHLLSEQFQGLSFVERQHSVFEILRASLGPEAQQISMLFTYTPEEYEQLQAA